LPAPQSTFAAEQQKALLAQQAREQLDPRVMSELPFRTGTDYIDGRRGHLYVVEVAKGSRSVRRVTNDERDYFAPAWSGDGQFAVVGSQARCDVDQLFCGAVFGADSA
jgi:hypothetical protein